MCRFVILFLIPLCVALPLKYSENAILYEDGKIDVEDYIENILNDYFETHIQPTLDVKGDKKSKYEEVFADQEKKEKMQEDMPNSDIILDNVALKIFLPVSNKTNFNTSMLTNFLNNSTKTSNMSYDLQKIRQRTKKNWIDVIKNNILHGTGRKNDTTGSLSPELLEQVRNSLNRSVGGFPFGKIQEAENVTVENAETDYVEKIRSFYPSCDVPRNTDEELWNDANTMNLFFSVDYANQNNNEPVNIASATLRLYKIPQETNSTVQENCNKDNSQYLSEEDKQIRVSVYWYSRSLKKHKAIKKRLADSKMVPLIEKQTTNYIEFNIRPATKAWVRGRNLGLGIVVEDQDGAIQQADKYFRDIGCHMQPPNQYRRWLSTPSEVDLESLLMVLTQIPMITVRLCPS